MTVLPDLNALRQEADDAIQGAKDEKALRDLEVKYLGRKGEITAILRSLKDLPADQKAEVGQNANDLKAQIRHAIQARRQLLTASPADVKAYDPTIPGKPLQRGALHPISVMTQLIWDTFTTMGYEIVDGPEVETDERNFQMLNIPKDHPARDEQDTYYVGDPKTQELLLRTHTTATSISGALPKHALPAKIIAVGKCFRRDAVDATHTPIFHQFDGIAVGKGITMADLKGTLHEAMRRIMEADVDVRFRISYFPFVEPGAEFDFSCTICGGKGCSTCKQTGWLEMGGCGMIHPAVLTNVGLDPGEVTGFAFGFGVERPFMIKHRITDIRLFVENDLRFLHQFG